MERSDLKTPRFLWPLCLGLWCLLTLAPAQAEARSIRKVHKAWELLMRNHLVQAYLCVGLLGDLYRGRVYPKAKVAKKLKFMFKTLGKEKLFLLKMTRGNRHQKKYYRHLRALTDLLLLSVRSLQKVVGSQGGKMSDHLSYRNAAGQSVNKLFSHPSRNKRRYYRGGWRKAIAHLGAHLGPGMAMGYLAVGLIADGYFQQKLSKSSVVGYLSTTLKLLKTDADQLKSAAGHVKATDRPVLARIFRGTISAYHQGVALGQFVKTRNRAYLRLYQSKRRLAWGYIQRFAR